MTEQSKANFLNKCEAAFLAFVERCPDYSQTEENARRLADVLRLHGESPDNVEHLCAAWKRLSVPRLVREGVVTLELIREMPTGVYAANLQSPEFEAAANYLLEQAAPRAPRKTLGDLQVEAGHRRRAEIARTQPLTHAVVQSVESSVRDYQSAFASGPSAPPSEAPVDVMNVRRAAKGVIGPHTHMPIARVNDEKIYNERIAQERKDADALEAARDKAARRIRVQKHRGR